VGDGDQIIVDAAKQRKEYDETARQMNDRVAHSHIGGVCVRLMET